MPVRVVAWQVGYPNLKISIYFVIPPVLTFGTLEAEMRTRDEPKFTQSLPCMSESNDKITSMRARRIAEHS